MNNSFTANQETGHKSGGVCPERAETHTVMCSWCAGEYTEAGPPKNIEGGYVSHGICPCCADVIRANLEKLKLSAPVQNPLSCKTSYAGQLSRSGTDL